MTNNCKEATKKEVLESFWKKKKIKDEILHTFIKYS
jgi:hypothetical protein